MQCSSPSSQSIIAQLFLQHAAGVAIVTMTDNLVIPAPASLETKVHGTPDGCWYNFVQWSDDSKHISFTTRSAGMKPLSTAPSSTPVCAVSGLLLMHR